MFNLKIARLILCLLLIVLSQPSGAFQQYNIDNIPNPKTYGNGYVSNPDQVLSETDVEDINVTIAKLEAKTHVEAAVVVVRDFNQNADDFDFALQLFRKWGIGKARADNGLLLFVAVNRHKYRFITGYGVEGLLPDASLKKIGETLLVPAFKEEAYGDGIKHAITTIADYLRQSGNKGELDLLMKKYQPAMSPWMEVFVYSGLMFLVTAFVFRHSKKYLLHHAPKKDKANQYDKVVPIGCMIVFIIVFGLTFLFAFTIGFGWLKDMKLRVVPYIVYGLMVFFVLLRYYGVLGSIRRFYKDDETFALAVGKFNKAAWWYIFISPLIVFGLAIEEARRRRTLKRFIPVMDSHQQPMVRINRDENSDGKPYLSMGQLKEESLGVYIYDIWVSKDGAEHRVITNKGNAFNKFDECPRCKQKTYGRPELITLQAATYSSAGSGKKVRECKSCQYEQLIKMVVLARLTRSSDSSGSGGGSSSSSGGGSWGGGSSGGGGAGGSW